MILIAHRGNTSSANQPYENYPEYIENALESFDCEVDVWYHNEGWWLGHDTQQYEIEMEWLYKKGLWIHCKNYEALVRLVKNKELNVFWHQKDDYTITSQGWIWAYPGMPGSENTIAVMPELFSLNLDNFAGICSDYIEKYND